MSRVATRGSALPGPRFVMAVTDWLADRFWTFDFTIENLDGELDGLRRAMRRKLVDALGEKDGETVEGSLFTRRGFDEWKDQLEELRIDRLARRARFTDRLLPGHARCYLR
jgi:hypothetical protein